MTPERPAADERTVLAGSAAAPPDNEERTQIAGAAVAPPSAEPASSSLGHNALDMGTKIGEFEIVGLVGEGGFGIVYLAYDHSLDRKVALKEYMPSELAQRQDGPNVVVRSQRHTETFAAGLRSFINEARLLAQFDHPSLVKVYRFWEANGTAYMVMPFYEGVTLKTALGQLGEPPDEEWLKSLLEQLLDALDIIHSRQCYHRDIAPDNILILPDETPLLLDFGAARRVIGDMTQALTVILKPGYAPIEQYAEVANLRQGPWTDLYALASVVYFAINGRAPVPAVARVISDPLEPLAQTAAGRYSEEFLAAIDSALQVKPEDRPQDIAQFRAALGFAERPVSTRYMPGEAGAPTPTNLKTTSGRRTTAQAARAKTIAQTKVAAPPRPPSGANKLVVIGASALAALLALAYVLYIVFDDPRPAGTTAGAAAPDTATSAPVEAPGLAEVQAKLAGFDCARLESTMNGWTAVVRGHVAADGDLRRIATELGEVKGVKKVDASGVAVIPRPYCAVVSAIGPYAGQAGAPRIALKGGAAAAFEGDKLITEITGPDYAGHVYADLYEPEGNVVHLLPNGKEKKNQVQARQRLMVGEDGLFGQQWDVVPPFGKHLLVVMSGRSRLFERERPEVEDIFGYLRDLRERASAKPADDRFAVHYVLIDVAPRK